MNSRVSLCLLIVSALAASLAAAGSEALRVMGSDTMKDFAERLTQWYGKKNPAVQFKVSVASPADSFAAVAGGKADVVESSRRVLHAESEALRSAQGKAYTEVQVATEIAGIAVNAANPVKELSLFQLRQVLSGSVKNWKQAGGVDAPITIYGLDEHSGLGSFLEDEFLGSEFISSEAHKFPNTTAVLSALSRDSNGIAYGNVVLQPDAKVRFLGIKASASGDAIAPTGDAIRSKRYKLVRPLFFYFPGAPQGELLRFAQWVLSPEGQLVVESVGYFPLSSTEREEGLKVLTGK